MSPAKQNAPAPPDPTLSRLLYVDDDPTLTLLTRISLERVGGFTVKTCASGPEALAEVKAFAPDLILLDVMMPVMDGPATLQALRRLPSLADIPVIFMTAKVQDDELARYRELGAADVIGKPYDPVKLPDLVRAIWQRCRGVSDLARLDTLRDVVGDAEFRRLLGTFLADLSRRQVVMADLAAARDHAGLERAAHSLKGTAGSYGLDGVSDLAARLEAATVRGDFAAIARALEALGAGIRASTAQLTARFGLAPGP
jgi:two-component system OmpR family response regulator